LVSERAGPRTDLGWYLAEHTTAERAAAAADDFALRSASRDITPTPFFDPAWFRENYEVKGPNAFLDYLDRKDRRFAWPSAFFASRWYARRYLRQSEAHPFLDYLTDPDGKDPHLLIDQAFLASQNGAWASPLVALEFLTDSEKFLSETASAVR
jgi:hypothetical protein